jgi:O-antigen/teichoic acid export membrane protein
LRIGDLRRGLASFGVVHTANAVWAIAHTLVQLVVLSRILPAPLYAAVVAITAAGLYLQPISQACGRANYIALRAQAGRPDGRSPPEVTTMLFASLALGLAASAILVFAVTGAGHNQPLALGLFLAGAILNNIWYYDLQLAMWALDVTLPFERLSFVRRLCLLAALGVFYVSQDLLVFSLLVNVIGVAFMLMLLRLPPDPQLLLPSNLTRLTRQRWRTQLRCFGTALLSTLSELTVFNATYAVTVYSFGVGPVLVTFDSILKLTRVGLTVTRNLSEIVLPRHSRARSEGNTHRSLGLFGMALGGALGFNLLFAAVLVVFGDDVFRLMLGPNDVVPSGAGVPAAAIQIAAALYGGSSFFLSLSGHARQIIHLTAIAAIAVAVFAVATVVLHPAIIAVLWAYAAFLGAVAVASGVLVLHALGRDRVVIAMQG